MSASFAGDSIYVSGAGSIYSEGASKTVSLSGSYYQPTVKYYETLNRTVSLVASPGVYVEFLIFRWELPVFNINIPIISGTQNLNFNNETPRFGLPNISTSTSTVDFGTVTVGQSKDRTFTLSNTGEATLNVASLTESSLHFSKVSPSTPFSISPGNSRTVTVRFTPQSTGSKSTALSIYSDDPDEPTKTVQLTGVGLPASTRIIRLVGDLAFGNVRVGQTATRMLTICNDGNSTLTVSGITYPSGFSGAWSGTIAAGGSRSVTVTFAPTAAQSYSGTVTVNSDKTSGTNTKACSGTGIPAATRIIRLVGDLAFGNVQVGQTATRTLTIWNDGNSTLSVSSITYPSGFSGAWSGTIAAGGSRSVTVTFAPTAAQSYSGTVTVNSDKTSGTNTKACSGTGTAPGTGLRVVDVDPYPDTVILQGTDQFSIEIEFSEAFDLGFLGQYPAGTESKLARVDTGAVVPELGAFIDTDCTIFGPQYRWSDIAPGEYTLTIKSYYFRDANGRQLDGEFSGTFPSGDGAEGGDFVCRFTVVPPPPMISLPEAVDQPAWTITTGGNVNWFGQASTYYYDNDAAQSGAISHNQESWMQTTVSGPGSVSFYWKVSSETNYDYLEFYVGGVRQDRISGSVNWTQKTVTVSGTGTHTLKWRYMKDGSVNSGSDCGWVDKVVWTAVNPPSVTSITPTSGPKYTYMKITGQNFGSSAGSVQFNGGTGTVSSWSDTVIYCRAPESVATGGVFVRTASGLDSGSATFTVTVPSIIHVNNTTNVPGVENGTVAYPFSTVQRGIDAASNGAEVVVAQGTYVENVDFLGKAITVRSVNPDDPAVVAATILDGNQAGSVVVFYGGEGPNSVLEGFTIQNGKAFHGGGIDCYSSPVIRKNLIENNAADWDGGGIFVWGTPLIEKNIIRHNTVGSWGIGGGIAVSEGPAIIRNNIIHGNTAPYGGGGVAYWSGATALFQNNTIIDNSAPGGQGGGGILIINGQAPVAITNSILRGNTAVGGEEISVTGYAPVTVSYCNIKGLESAFKGALSRGDGNQDFDPQFANAVGGDYHLKSRAGRWDPAADAGAGAWVVDAVTSPCIDAGDPASDYSNEPSPNGGRVNTGAYGDTAYASKSVPPPDIASVLPGSGPSWTLMKVTGSWFGFAEGSIEVTGTPLTILAWSDTEIRCEVPPEAASGPLVVKRWSRIESNVLAFAVTDPTILYVDDDNTSGIENGTLTWPFSTVQRAIRAATNGDTVQVAEGTYIENVNFLGKAITVRSVNPDAPAVVAATVLDGNHSGSVVTFNHGEGPDSVLKGFTIRNGSGTDYCGAGVHCHGSSPTVEKNVITGNTALAHGGGVYSFGGSPTIRDNRVEGNEARWFGGGIACWNSTATVTGNLIRDNAAHWYGGGLLVHGPAAPTVKNNVLTGNTGSEGAGIACLYQCAPLLENNTLAGNVAERAGGGLYAGWDCSPVVRNGILWANAAPDGPELALDTNSTVTVSYSDIQGGQPLVHVGTGCSVTWETGNLDLDPLLDGSGWCHLKSTGGRYDRTSGLPPESAGAWVTDAVHSPCIDAGDPLSAYAAELLPNGDRINMGAWGNTAYASKPAGVGGLAVEGAKVQVDGAEADGPVGADDGLGDERQENEQDGCGKDQGDGGDTNKSTPSRVFDGPAPRLEGTVPVLGGNLAGRTTLTLTFDRPVTVGGGWIEIYGDATGAHNDYALAYENSKRTVRLKWASPLPADDYEVRLVAESISDEESRLPLDGEVADPADPDSLPSGDGKMGGDAYLEFEAR
ncbi:MAG: choice-of-anchor D domain-containing protein [Phycisphaerae bacterium]